MALENSFVICVKFLPKPNTNEMNTTPQNLPDNTSMQALKLVNLALTGVVISSSEIHLKFWSTLSEISPNFLAKIPFETPST